MKGIHVLRFGFPAGTGLQSTTFGSSGSRCIHTLRHAISYSWDYPCYTATGMVAIRQYGSHRASTRISDSLRITLLRSLLNRSPLISLLSDG